MPSDINSIVKKELVGIPGGSLVQNMFRAAYQNFRAHGLGAGAERALTAGDAWVAAVRAVRKEFPGFVPATEHTD